MSLPLSRSPYDHLLDACAPVLRPMLLVDGDDHGYARIGLSAPAPLIDASRPHGEPAVLTASRRSSRSAPSAARSATARSRASC